jgi:hypothetical protein
MASITPSTFSKSDSVHQKQPPAKVHLFFHFSIHASDLVAGKKEYSQSDDGDIYSFHKTPPHVLHMVSLDTHPVSINRRPIFPYTNNKTAD